MLGKSREPHLAETSRFLRVKCFAAEFLRQTKKHALWFRLFFFFFFFSAMVSSISTQSPLFLLKILGSLKIEGAVKMQCGLRCLSYPSSGLYTKKRLCVCVCVQKRAKDAQ